MAVFDKIKDIFKPNTQAAAPSTKPLAAVSNTNRTASPTSKVGIQSIGSKPTANRLDSIGTPTQKTTPAPSDASLKKLRDFGQAASGIDKVFTPQIRTDTGGYKPVGELSSRAYRRDVAAGNSLDKVSGAQKQYNLTYYKTIDDPTHTKMYTDLEKADSKTFQTLYKSGREKLDSELKDVGKQYGKNSNEYKALQQFSGDYEILGQNKEISRSTRDSRQYSAQLDDSIRQIYGGLMSRPDFQEKVAAGREAIGKNQQELHAFELATKNATQAQKDLLLYIRETEGNKGVQKFMASSLGQLLNAANANQIYADTVAKDSDALRTAGLYGQAIGPHIGTVVPDTASFVRGLTGKDADDPDDKNLGGGYTISDSVDDFLRSQLAGDLAEAGVDQEQFDAAAQFGLDILSTKKEDWVKDMLSNASDYQKKYLGFLSASSGEEVAKSAWQGIKQQEKVVWDVAKKGSNRVSRGTDDALGALAYEYYGLGGAKIPGRDETVPQFLMSAMQSGAEQIVPALTAGLIGNIYTAAGAAPEVIKKASRIASTIPFSTMIAGRSYNEASQKENVTRLAAIVYGVVEAMMEGLTEYGMGVAGGAGGALTRGAKDKLAARITSPVLRALLTMGVDALGEGEQERIQEAIEPIISSLLLHEGDLGEAVVGAVDPRNILDSDRMYAGALGAATALLMGPVSVATDVSNNRFYSELGKSLNAIDALSKTVDVILNTDLSSAKIDTEAFEAAKKTAQIIKDGGKVSDLAVGKMVADFGKAGGDLSHLVHPETQAYNKETLTVDNLIAGAKSMLVDLGGDAKLAEDIVKASRGEQISQETLRAIQADTNAMQVLTQLQGELDMSKDTALSRAARASTRAGTGNQVYDTLKAENTDKTIATPAAQRLYEQNVEWDDAQQIGALIDKVMSGVALTEDEAELISVGIPAVRSVIQEITGVELSESSTIGAVMTAMNDFAAQMAKTKEMQAAVKESTKQTARMPIPPAATGNSLGGVEISHDDFIKKFMARNEGVTLEEAEEAWNQRRMADAALSGEEENNGTVSSEHEGRNPDLAGRSPIPAATQRTAESGRAADTGAAEQGGRVETDRQPADAKRGYTPDQVITSFNAKQRDLLRDCIDAGFKTVTLINGPIRHTGVDANGKPTAYTVNAEVDGNGNLVLRWDNPYASPLRVALHERVHLWLSSFRTLAERQAYVVNALNDIFGDDTAAFKAMYDIYAKKYATAYSGFSGEAFAARVMEEMLADMYAGMNNYGSNAGSYQSQAEMYLENTNLRGRFFGEGNSRPDFGDQFSLTDPFADDVDRSLPPEVRPLPGEEDAHPDLTMFSLTGMAEGGNFELQLNDSGQPYALIDKRTGRQVDHVTAEMMIGTPLGNIIQLAVENGNIDADDAAKQREMLAQAMNLIIEYKDAAMVWELAGSQLFSAMKSNADDQYTKTIDFTTICTKTKPIVQAMSEAMKQLGRGLTRREVEAVYEKVGKQGLATPCPVCYVFSRWIGVGGLLDQIRVFQEQYVNEDEATIAAFMNDVEQMAWEIARVKDKADYFKKGKAHTRENMSIGKILSDLKSGPNRRAAEATEALSQHYQAVSLIQELRSRMPTADSATAAKWEDLIEKLQASVLSEDQIEEQQEKLKKAEEDIEPYERYQWLAKTLMKEDRSKIGPDGESIKVWKKNPKYKPVPKDVLFDLNAGETFAKEYPLTWAFRTGKGCAAGKAILPYTDARVGSTIQGAAASSADALKNIRKGGMEELKKILEDASLTKRQKTAKIKRLSEFLIDDSKRMHETLARGRKWMRRQNLIGGMRYQSTSDFRYEFGSDYLMTFLEMQALGANVQLYTKVIEAVDFLASTGADCNLSVMSLGDGYVTDPKTGEKKLVFSNITGINADAAIEKAKQYDNVQLILVGINDESIKLALEGTDVTFVIPFHGSGQSVHQIQTLMDLIGEHLDVYKAKDYSDLQSDHVSPKQTTEQKAMWNLRMAIIMGNCMTKEQKSVLEAWENAGSKEERDALADRLVELGKAQAGLTAAQKALLAKNPHLQKLYNMFYVDKADLAFYNNLAKDQAEHIFPYEYWDKTLEYKDADQNGEIFKAYCESMGIIPRFSGRDSDGADKGYGNFAYGGENGKSVKGYWKLLIDRSMYENVYDAEGKWIGYGKYRAQQQINMTNVDIGDLNPETGEKQFPNGEMTKRFNADRVLGDSALITNAVGEAIQEIEAMRSNGDYHDKAKVSKDFRDTLLKANAELRGMDDDGSIVRASIADESAEETVVYIKDGYNRDTGETVDFINAILDGRKKGETRQHNRFPYKNWVGLAKGKEDGKVYGRVKFGKPYQITNQSPEYQDALIAGTDYDLADGESKWYYPVLEIEDFRDNPKPFRPIAQTGKYQRSAPDVRASIADDQLTESQQAIVEFNNNQTEVGSELRHLSGEKQKRYQNNVGKKVDGKIYVHKLYANEVIEDPELLRNAEAALKTEYPDFEYNCITYDPKTGDIRFDEAPDFDTADEPIPGWQITVTRGGKVKKPHYENQIWHHKWQWVKNDYQDRNPKGFNVEESWDRSRQYLNHLRPVPMNDYRFSNSKNSEKGSFAQRGIPDARVWNEQLRYFGLDDIIHDERWKAKESPDTRASIALDSPIFDSDQRQEPETDSYGSVFYIKPTDSSWEILHDDDDNLMNTQYMKDVKGFDIFDNPMDPMPPRAKHDRVFSKSKMRGHKTQKTGETVSTYDKIGTKLEEIFGKEKAHSLRILDASSGTGFGTQALLDRGFNVTDLEPFPPRIEPKSGPIVEPYVPNYRNYGDLIYALETGQEEPFDIVISNAVINVMAQDARAEVIAALGKFAKPDGHIFINTFNKTQPSKSEPNIVIQPDTDKLGRETYTVSTDTIQKGFTTPELKGFIRDVLNQTGTEGFDFSTVKPPKGEKSLGGMTTWIDMNGETIEEQGRNQQPDTRFSAADAENAEETNTSTNPYKEGTFEYTVYDMLGKINSPQELQDYINGLREKQQQDNETRNAEPGLFPKRKLPPVNEKEQQIRRAKLDELIEKYGAFKQGEKAARKYPIPEKVSETRRVNRGVRTIVEAKAIPDRLAERLGGEVLVNELLTYEPITDSDALSRERSELARLGYEKALKEWESKSGTDRFPTKYDIAFGGLLLRQAANNGDDAIALRIAADLAAMERQAGQVSQAGRLLKQLGPVGQLYYVKKAVDRLNHQNEGRIAKGSMQPIVIDPDLAEAVVTAKEQKDIDAAMDELIQSIADQMPVTVKDRWDAWRYLSMLGNPRTHIRNIAGNAIFAPVRFAKDLLAAAGESVFIQDESQRTKDARALMRDPRYNDIREFAKADYKEMEPYLTGTGKMNPLNEIMNKRKVLPGVLDKISRKNDDWLTGEDAIFLKKAYVNALTQFIAARGASLEDLSADVEGAKILNEARKYAALEAQKATYRDFSQAAAKLNALKRGNSFASWLLDGVMPFTKTPINILKRGVEYSPIGLAKALTVDLNRVKKGDITAAEAIDHAAAGLTGTGVAVLGWLLAAAGMARGGPDDDDKKDALEKAQGHQDYSLEIDGKSYTIDWMAPVALPFFVGVEAQKVTSGDGPSSFFDFVNAMMLISEPMTSLSMLEGINSTLSAVRQGEPSEAIMTVLTNAAANYLSQGVPTFAGQIARTADPYRRSTYVDKNSETPAWMQRFLQNVQGKVPGLADNKMAYVDTWGRKDTNESMFLRGIENFISPGYANKIHETLVDTELLRLYDATGDNSMLPGTVAKYFQVEGETLNLTADQYEEFKTVTGKTAFELIGGLLGDVAYNGLDDQNKAKVIQQALKIATAVGKQKVAPTYQTDGWIERAIDHDNTETAAVYHTLEGLDTGLSNYQLISAMDWLSDDERGKLILAEHPNTDRNMTDYTRKKHKFVLTDDQIKREREIYESLFWSEYAALLSNPKYINGDITTRAELIKTMQSNVSTDARKTLGNELRAAGYTSVLLDDSDVPDQVANLYDLLNRG